jgi:two-component system LytT family response regulator
MNTSLLDNVPLRVVVADDEYLCRQKIKVLLKAERNVQLLAECSQVQQTIEAVQDLRPDLLLLDIQMPDGNGFDLLRRLPAGELPLVIFTTAYDQYALKAFEAHALDYLLKPFDQGRFHKAIERARVDVLKSREGTLTSRVLELIRQPGAVPDNRFIIKSGGRVVFLDPDEIDWIEAAANYIRLHTERQSYLVRESISHVAERLQGGTFARIHRSIIVNLNKIQAVHPCNSGEYMVILQNGKELSCSRNYRSSIRSLLETV